MDQDINDVYRQTVKISTLFASCCKERANFYLASMALESAYPIVSQFLLEDAPNASNRAYVLEQLLSSLNGEDEIKRSWFEFNKNTLRSFLQEFAPHIERKMTDKHIENMAGLWNFGQICRVKETTGHEITRTLGLSETELKQLNKKLIDESSTEYYENFFKKTIEQWCRRAQNVYQHTNQTFNNQIATTSKVKL